MKMFYRLITSNKGIVLSVILSRLLLDYLYINVISPNYFYRGLTYSFSNIRMVLSWIVLFIFIGMILYLVNFCNDERLKGAIMINILLCCSAVPTTTIIAYFNLGILFSVELVLYWLMIVFLYRRMQNNVFSIKGPTLNRNKIVLYFITAVLALNLFMIVVGYTGLSFNVNLHDVYETRANFKTERIPTVLRYLFFGSTMAFPIIIVFALESKRYLLASIASICQIVSFFVDGRKVTLFMFVLTVAGYFLIKKFDVRLIPFGSFAIILIGCIEKWVFHSSFLINYVVRRLFILPAYLQYAYYDYFLNNPKDYLRQSIVGRLGFHSPYDASIPTIIGTYYYGGSYANNGLFSDAYMNFGIIGAIVFPFLIVLALKLLDDVSKKLPIGLCMGFIFSLSSALLSSSFFTVMLTHGYLMCCIVVALIPSIERKTN